MVVPYASIASAVEGVARLSFTIYTAGKDAPAILQRVSRELKSVYLLLEQIRSEAEDPNSTINRYGDHKKTQFQTVVTHIKTPLEFLHGKAQNYKQSGRGVWQRILIGGFAKDQIKDSLDEILHHVAYLQMLHLSLSDGDRYLRLDTLVDDFCQNEVEKEEVTSSVFSLEQENVNPDEWNDLWEVLLPKLQELHYASDDMQNHKTEILAYVNYKTNIAREEHGFRGRRQLTLELEAEPGAAQLQSSQDPEQLDTPSSHPLEHKPQSQAPRAQEVETPLPIDTPTQLPGFQTEEIKLRYQEGKPSDTFFTAHENPPTADGESQPSPPQGVGAQKEGAKGAQPRFAKFQPPEPAVRRQAPSPDASLPRKAKTGQSESFGLVMAVEKNSNPTKEPSKSVSFDLANAVEKNSNPTKEPSKSKSFDRANAVEKNSDLTKEPTKPKMNSESPGYKAYDHRGSVTAGWAGFKFITAIIVVSLSAAYIAQYRSAGQKVPVTPICMIIIFCLGLFSFLLEPVYYVSETPGAENSVRVVLAFKILVLTPLIIISFVLHPRLTGKLSDGSPEDISPAAFHLHIAFTVVALIHWIINMVLFFYIPPDDPSLFEYTTSHPSSTAATAGSAVSATTSKNRAVSGIPKVLEPV